MTCLLCSNCGKLYATHWNLAMIDDDKNVFCGECMGKLGIEKFEIDNLIRSEIDSLERIMALEDVDFFEKEVENLLTSNTCSKCPLPTENPRICLNCTGIKAKKLENQRWIIQDLGKDQFFKSLFICADCGSNDHEGHKTVPVLRIQNLLDTILYDFYKNYPKDDMILRTILQIDIQKSKMKLFSIYFNLHDKYDLDDCSDELKDSFEEERKKLDDLVIRDKKLLLREIKVYEDELQLHINHHTQQNDPNDRYLKKLKRLKEEFTEFFAGFEINLSQGEIEEIDMELESRMMKLEEEYKNRSEILIEMEEGSKFYKYRAISKEIEKIKSKSSEKDIDSEEDTINSNHKAIRKIRNCIESMDIKREDYNQRVAELKKSIKFLQMKIIEAALKMNRKARKWMRKEEREIFVRLMQHKFFPNVPGASLEDIVFREFFEHF